MTDLAAEIQKRLPARLVRLIRRTGELAAEQRHASYLVGGVVRDLLLGRRNLDVDVVVEGDAVRLARRLATEIRRASGHPPAFQHRQHLR